PPCRHPCSISMLFVHRCFVMIDIVTLPVRVGGLDFSPALDRKEEILLHLRSCVVHAVTDSHVRVLWMQINFQHFVIDRDVGLLAFVRGAGSASSRNSALPCAAISET